MSFKDLFEKQLKQKIMQKATTKQTDEAYLIKSFKFFDIFSKGSLTYQQFHQALEKIGVYYSLEVGSSSNFQEVMTILQEYDTNGDGNIDYKEFSLILYGDKIVRGVQRKVDPEASKAK